VRTASHWRFVLLVDLRLDRLWWKSSKFSRKWLQAADVCRTEQSRNWENGVPALLTERVFGWFPPTLRSKVVAFRMWSAVELRNMRYA